MFHVAFATEIKCVNDLFSFPTNYFDELHIFQISIK